MIKLGEYFTSFLPFGLSCKST